MLLLVERIKELCRAQGKTLFSLEQECGFGNGTVHKWDKNAPSISKVIAVAKALGVSVSYLIGENEKKPTLVSEDELRKLDENLIKRLVDLRPDEIAKVDAFVQGLQAARGD